MKKIFPFLILSLILFTGCREEIIPPGENIGLLNSPIKDNFYRSYSFRIDASNLNLNVADSVWLNSSSSVLNIISSNYVRGSVTINLINPIGSLQFTEILDDNRTNVRRVIDNTNIDRIELIFENFTGNVNIKLNALN